MIIKILSETAKMAQQTVCVYSHWSKSTPLPNWQASGNVLNE